MPRPPHLSIAIVLCLHALTAVFAESPIKPGDHIAIVGNTFADQLRIHGYLETQLLLRSSGEPVSIRNLGWGGDMLNARDRPTNFPSEESFLTAHETDVIVACFGMGESFDGPAGLEEFKVLLEQFFDSHAGKQYNGESEVRLVLVSPIACEDLNELTPKREQINENLEAYTSAMRDVASKAKVPFLDLFSVSRYLMDESVGPNLTTNGIHLNPYGYWAVSKTFCDQLISVEGADDDLPWQITLDAANSIAEGRGVDIDSFASDESGLRFRVTETSAPTPAPPTDAELPQQLQFNRDTLIVKNLMPGSYELSVDGKTVVAADESEWSEGVAIDASPAHQEVEAYRIAVNDKNLQFTYSWKALNQVHIVGERKSSPSGRALPQEIIEFNELANQRDAVLRKGIQLKTRQWRLKKVSR